MSPLLDDLRGAEDRLEAAEQELASALAEIPAIDRRVITAAAAREAALRDLAVRAARGLGNELVPAGGIVVAS